MITNSELPMTLDLCIEHRVACTTRRFNISITSMIDWVYIIIFKSGQVNENN